MHLKESSRHLSTMMTVFENLLCNDQRPTSKVVQKDDVDVLQNTHKSSIV